jgi:metallo-beta-lactamase family protein
MTLIYENFSVFTMDAGHILGSAMYQFLYYENDKKTSITFTGDSGNSPAPLLRNTDKISSTDYLVIDSVYGDRNHEPKEERDAKFRQIISETIAVGGAVVMPAFSLERTQVILYELNNLIEEGKIPSVPVYLDSPLGEKVTEVYKKFSADFNGNVQNEIKNGDDIFNFPKLHIIHGHLDSQKIKETPNPKIIIAGSGMSSGGRVVGHEMDILPDPKNTLLLMGYQSAGTLGRELQDKPKQVEIDGQIVPVRARIEMISGYSSHKDSDHLVQMAKDTQTSLKKIFVVMGEPRSSTFLAQKLHNELNVETICPERGEIYKL